MPYWSTCRQAVSMGINTLVVHEPTFYTHWDLDESHKDFHGAPETAKKRYQRLCREKSQWLRESGLVIIRCHDVLDRVPHFGIPFGFGQALGLSADAIVRSRPYYNVYRIDPAPAAEVAKKIAGDRRQHSNLDPGRLRRRYRTSSEAFPNLVVVRLDQGCGYRWVVA